MRAKGGMRTWLAVTVLWAAVGAPHEAVAQDQESIEIARLELEDASALMGCFRSYVRNARRPGADVRLRACVSGAHGRVTTVSVTVAQDRIRCLGVASLRVGREVRRAEDRGPSEALDRAREELAQCAAEIAAPPPPVGALPTPAPSVTVALF